MKKLTTINCNTFLDQISTNWSHKTLKEKLKNILSWINNIQNQINEKSDTFSIIINDSSLLPPEYISNPETADIEKTIIYTIGKVIQKSFEVGDIQRRFEDIEYITNLPTPLEYILIKCTALLADDRYNSLSGLELDISKCINELSQDGKIPPFFPGENDPNMVVKFKPHVYGRLLEQQRLIHFLGSKSNTLSISGYAGIGKTSLIKQTLDTVLLTDYILIHEKFNQHNQIPFQNISHALNALYEKFKEYSKYAELVESFGKKLSHFNTQKSKSKFTTPDKKQYLFSIIFEILELLNLANKQVVLVFDDLQWADELSLLFLDQILQKKAFSNIKLIVSYRNNKHEQNAIFRQFLDNNVTRFDIKIILENLNQEDITELLSDTLNEHSQNIIDLSDCVYAKTQGNPFFIQQLVNALYDRKGLFFNTTQKKWTWYENVLNTFPVTDNVADILSGRLATLNPSSINLLTKMALIGSVVTTSDLEIICALPKFNLLLLLRECEIKGFVVMYNAHVSFAHDKIQETAYKHLTENEKKCVSLEVAQRLFQHKKHILDYNDQYLYIITSLIQKSVNSIFDLPNIIEFAPIFLKAGLKSKQLCMFQESIKYLSFAGEAWDNIFELKQNKHAEHIQINTFLAENYFLTDNENMGHSCYEKALSLCTNQIEKITVIDSKICVLNHLNKQNIAVQEGLKYFTKIKHNPHQSNLMFSLNLIYKIMVNKSSIKKALAEPVLEGGANYELFKKECGLLVSFITVAFFVDQKLFATAAMQFIKQSVNHPLKEENLVFLSALTITFVAAKQYQLSHHIVEHVQKNIMTINNPSHEIKINFVAGGMLSHWHFPMRVSYGYLNNARKTGVKVGDMLFHNYTKNHLLIFDFFAGKNLYEVGKELSKYHEYLIAVRDYSSLLYLNQMLITIGALTNTKKYKNATYPESAKNIENRLVEMKKYIFKLFCAYFLNDEFEISISKYKEHVFQGSSLLQQQELVFYMGLLLAREIPKETGRKKLTYLWELIKINREFKAHAKRCPENFLAKSLTIRAELYALFNCQKKAIRLMKRALDINIKNTRINHSALIAERLAMQDIQHQKKWIERAITLYEKWGAAAKVTQLKEQLVAGERCK